MQHGNKIFVTETKNEDEEIISTTKNTKFYHFLKNAQLSPSVERGNSSWKLVGTVSVAVWQWLMILVAFVGKRIRL